MDKSVVSVEQECRTRVFSVLAEAAARDLTGLQLGRQQIGGIAREDGRRYEYELVRARTRI
eukprot:COSAG01_NODE_170_length_23136_cov_24.853931_7_plen_61_part_00